jgi:hypothetical protein
MIDAGFVGVDHARFVRLAKAVHRVSTRYVTS